MSKLQYRYTGPHTVLREINSVVFKALVNGVERTVHASKMNPVVPRQPKSKATRDQEGNEPDIDEPDMVSEEGDRPQSRASTIDSDEEYDWEELATINGWDDLSKVPDPLDDEDDLGVLLPLTA